MSFSDIAVRINDPSNYQVAASNRAVSYLDDKRQVVCEYGGADGLSIFCDAEITDRTPRASLVRSFGFPADPVGFAISWTHAELMAKLHNVPIVIWLKAKHKACDLCVQQHDILHGNIAISFAFFEPTPPKH